MLLGERASSVVSGTHPREKAHYFTCWGAFLICWGPSISAVRSCRSEPPASSEQRHLNRPGIAGQINELITGRAVVVDDAGQGGHRRAAVTTAVVHQHDWVLLLQASPSPLPNLVR